MAEGTDHGKHAAPGDSALLAAALGTVAGSPQIEALIARQIALADLQIEDIKRDDGLRRWALRYSNASAVMKVAFELALAFVFLAVAVVVAGAIWSAHEARGLVIESFQVPASMAERGLTGQVVASRILDKLSGLQDKTDSLRAPNSYANNWGDDIKVQIPDTGVSIGEFNRYLRQWLGHETHITGEVWREGDGIAVVARAGADQGVVFTGKESELDALLQQAAESVFEKTQGYRYAVYLARSGKGAQSQAVLTALIAKAAPAEQAWAYSLWSNNDFLAGHWQESIAKNRRAIALDSGNALAWENLAENYRDTGQDEKAFLAFGRSWQLISSDRADIDPQKIATARLFAHAQTIMRQGDYAEALKLADAITRAPDYAGSGAATPLVQMLLLGALHDRIAMRRQFAVFEHKTNTGYLDSNEMGLQAAYLDGDGVTALRAAANIDAEPKTLVRQASYFPRQYAAYKAFALAEMGKFAKADALIAPTPADCDVCTQARARIAMREKRWDAASWWLDRYAAETPDMPFAATDRGFLLLARGDAAGAIAQFTVALGKGPNFADALEGWGEALMAENRSDLALAKFQQAARLAPHWDRLQHEWALARRYVGTDHG